MTDNAVPQPPAPITAILSGFTFERSAVQCLSPVYAKKGAHQCGDPFSTSKSKPYRITVSHQRTNSACRGAKIDKLRAGLRGLGHTHSKHDGSQAFSKIHKEDRIPKPLAQ